MNSSIEFKTEGRPRFARALSDGNLPASQAGQSSEVGDAQILDYY
jgi:hypothetical protein